MQVIVDGLLVEYQNNEKSGRKFLLVHGWGDNQDTFSQLKDELIFDDQFVSLDLPGFGRSQKPKDAWTLGEYADFVGEFLKKIKYSPEVIIAHSNGAAVVILGMSTNKITTKKLVLIGAAGIRNRETAKKMITKIMAKTGKAALFWLPKSKKEKLQKKYYGAIGSDMNTVPHMKETYRKTVAQDVQADAAKITVPTLLIYGENDKATPALYGGIYNEKIKGSKLVIIPQAAHFIHQDNAKEVAELIEEFIK